MHVQGQFAAARRLLLLVAVIVLVSRAALGDVPLEWKHDAALCDVFFLDAERGWAVGDRGVIWHTADGGKSWELQQSGATARLESVQFLDADHGWAVGGTSDPYTHTGRGLLLSTSDGGRTWKPSKATLPRLRRIRMFGNSGWAIGDATALCPSGLLVTRDAARTWSVAPGGLLDSWCDGEFFDPTLGVVCGADGFVARTAGGRLDDSQRLRSGPRSGQVVRFATKQLVWLAGEGGLVMQSRDGGRRWIDLTQRLPMGSRQFDFTALAARGDDVWVAGTPGTLVFHSPDAGTTWEALPTGGNLPISAMTFVDRHHGWAAGALGTIMTTRDGGRSWRIQRQAADRVALLCISSRAENVPLEVVAQLCGADGYRGAVHVLSHRDEPLGLAPTLVQRRAQLADAVATAGGCAAEIGWAFPVPVDAELLRPTQVVDHWNRTHRGEAVARLEASVARAIRTWRPDVVVTDGAVESVVRTAVTDAADAKYRGDSIPESRLDAWQVKRILVRSREHATGAVEVATTRLNARTGRSIGEDATAARALLADRWTTSPLNVAFRIANDAEASAGSRRDFFAGLTPDPAVRRALNLSQEATLESIKRTAAARRNVKAILEHAGKDRETRRTWLAQWDQWTRDLDETSAAEMAYQLGQAYVQSGQWDLAAEAMENLARQYPSQPLARPALAWLAHYATSDEAAVRLGQTPKWPVVQATSGAATSTTAPRRLSRGVEIGPLVEKIAPQLAAQPNVHFSLAVMERREANRTNSATNTPALATRYQTILASRPHDLWWRCAEGERWLIERRGAAPKPVLQCKSVSEKPYLDGELDDAVWQKAEVAELRPVARDRAELATTIRLAHDGEFLFVAIRCRAAANKASTKQPARDADLSADDRVELLIDVDRDYATYHRLAADSRGRSLDSCWGDNAWNPQWFLATGGDEGTWTAEAAIPLKSLATGVPQAGDAWAVGLVRLVPSVGLLSWTNSATPEGLPAGFGYVIFE
jgi:photosystem II stability/assembly factor-like uncharacterized protein